jgi:predicted N-acyltransferase
MIRPDLSLESVMPDLEPLLTQRCRRERRLLITVSNVAASHLSGWQQAGFLATHQAGVSAMDLPLTYDQYLESLQRKNRQELRRARRRGVEYDARFEFGSLADDGDQIYSLICEVFANHGTARKAMPFTSQFLATLEREMPGDVLFLRGYLGKSLTGVCLCLLNGTTFWAPMMGLHYMTARSSYLYFLMQDEMVRWGIEHGMQKIFVGKTNESIKQRHGFHQEESWFCYRTGARSLTWALALASPLVRRLLQH